MKTLTTKENFIPKTLQPFLWSYDIKKIDLARDKRRIITNVLNFGTIEAVKDIFKIYNKREITETVANPMSGEWNDKSLNFWSLILNVEPKKSFRQFE